MEIGSDAASRIFLQEIDEDSTSQMGGSVGEGPNSSLKAVHSIQDSVSTHNN